VEATKPGNRQHSRTELPFDAEIAVRFNAGGTNEGADAAHAEEVEDGALAASDESTSAASEERTMVWSFMMAVECWLETSTQEQQPKRRLFTGLQGDVGSRPKGFAFTI
jgi:hypothetical protein